MILKDGKAWTKLEDTRRGTRIKKEIDKYLLSFQSLNICPLLPVTLTQFNRAVPNILS
jgi:hypothetical protein